MTEATAPAAAKVDPGMLAIRSSPPRAIRFKRWAIIGIATTVSIGLIFVAWRSLTPRLVRTVDVQSELSQPNAHPGGDALRGVPATYGDVPKLGPPLPGDLGKPILERQQQLIGAGPADDQQVRQAQVSEQAQRLAELKAARQSGLLVQRGQVQPVSEAPPAATVVTADLAGDRSALDPDHDPNAQGHKAAFVGTFDPKGDLNPHTLVQLGSPYTLSAGSVISASLITGVRSDLPGLVTAQVTENIYDSATGRLLLVPQGARLVGTYDSVIAFGQKRALIVWQRILMPDGSSLRIDNVPATDAAGYAGLADKVDLHTWQLLKGVALSTLLGVSSELARSGQSDLVQAIRMSTQDNVSRAGDQITRASLGVQPTITIRPGTPVRLVVHKDLVFAPSRQGN